MTLARSVDTTPYDATVWLAVARDSATRGSFEHASEAIDLADLLGAPPAQLAVARSHVLVAQAIREGSGERADEAVDLLAPLASSDSEVALALVEAVVHATAKRMRERITAALDALQPTQRTAARTVRAAYLAIFSLAVGAKLDERNGPVLDAILRLAERLRELATETEIGSLLATVRGKRCDAHEICQRVAELASEIDDVRIVRLLLRERLATIADPQERLALFEKAMARIPRLDGIAHDYLQLLHLVAKRALATGSVAEARASWRQCLDRDPDNLGAVENLHRLARIHGETDDLRLRYAERLGELRAIYVRHSPRADLVLARTVAVLEDRLAARLEAPLAGLATIEEVARERARITAIARLGGEAELQGAVDDLALRGLLEVRPVTDAALDHALAIIARPGRADWQAHGAVVARLVTAFSMTADGTLAQRAAVADLLGRLCPVAVEPIVRAALRAERPLGELLVEIAYGPSIAAAERALATGDIESNADQVASFLAAAGHHPTLLGLVARYAIRDPRLPLDEAIARARYAAARVFELHRDVVADAEVEHLARGDEAVVRELVGVRRAELLVTRGDGSGALTALAWAYSLPFVTSPLTLSARAWERFPLVGTAGYRLTVAIAMQLAIDAWSRSAKQDLFNSPVAIRTDLMSASELAIRWAASAHESFAAHEDVEHAGIASRLVETLAARLGQLKEQHERRRNRA